MMASSRERGNAKSIRERRRVRVSLWFSCMHCYVIYRLCIDMCAMSSECGGRLHDS